MISTSSANLLAMEHGPVCLSGCHDNASPDEQRGNVIAFHCVAFRRLTQRAVILKGIDSVSILRIVSAESRRERLMYSTQQQQEVREGSNVYGAVSCPRVCFCPCRHND